LIREPRVGEGSIVNEAVAESFKELNAWMPWAKELPTVEDTEKHSRESAAKFIARKDFGLRIWSRDETRFIGSTGLHVKDWSPRVFEIGYWVRTSEAGKGYITETVNALTAYGFTVLKASRIFIRCDDRNPASARVAEKAGYQLEGIMRNDSVGNDGELRSTRFYARIA